MRIEQLGAFGASVRGVALVCAVCVGGGLAATSSGCEKDSQKITWDDTDRPSIIEDQKAAAASLTVPALFASIPADTPYVFAAFQPIPASYWKKACDEMCPALEKLLRSAPSLAGAGGFDNRVLAAVLSEISGNLSANGFRKLGLSPDPRYAVYGLGPMPVGRIELADPRALAATVSRIEAKSGVKFPTRSEGAQQYWYAATGNNALAAGIVGKELVVTFGPAAAVARAVPVLFGTEKLASTMADGAALKKLGADYGFAPYGLGYVDLRRFADVTFGTENNIHTDIQAAYTARTRGGGGSPGANRRPRMVGDDEEAEPMPGNAASLPDPGMRHNPFRPPPAGVRGARSPRCQAEMRALAVTFPRFVAGYDEIGAKRASFSGVLEMSPAAANRIKALQVTVPGVTTRLPNKPLFAVGGAIDVTSGMALLADLKSEARRIGRVCNYESWSTLGDGMGLGFPDLPLPGIRGGIIVLQGGNFSGGMPSNLSGYAIVGMEDAKGSLAGLKDLIDVDIKADGKFHTVPLGPMGGVVGSLKVAAKDDAIVLAAGDRSRSYVEDALKQRGGKSPLVMFAYDVGRFSKMMRSTLQTFGPASGMGGGASDAMESMMKAQERLMGMAIFSLQATDRGLMFVGRTDLK